MDRIRVLIADDEESVLDVLSALMAAESDLEIAGSARDAETAIQLATREQPDVAILDVRMPGGGGPRAAREILRRSPASKIIALSAHEEVDSVLEMLRAGALGYVVKGDSTDAIVQGHPPLPRAAGDVLLPGHRGHGARACGAAAPGVPGSEAATARSGRPDRPRAGR